MTLCGRVAAKLKMTEREVWRAIRAGAYRHVKLEKRTLSIPDSMLGKVQGALAKFLSYKLAVHDAAHGAVHGRSILSAAAVHGSPGVLVGLDVHDFFGTVTSAMFRHAVHASGGLVAGDVNFVLKACFEDGVLPQGAPTSPVIANASVYFLDEELSAVRGGAWRYSRFVDDLFFSHAKDVSRHEVIALLTQARHIVEEYGFKLAASKRRIARRHQCQTIVGLIVNEGKPRVPRPFHRKIRAALHARLKGKPSTWDDARLKGAIAFVEMVEPEWATLYKMNLELAQIQENQRAIANAILATDDHKP